MRNSKSSIKLISFCALSVVLLAQCARDNDYEDVKLPTKAEVGRLLFFDESLSNPVGQSCATCHDPLAAFSDPGHSIVTPGIVDGLFGNRNAPSASYTMFSPSFYFDDTEELYIGGQFLDGRAKTLEDQAKLPLTNPVEMNNTDLAMVAGKIRAASYFNSLVELYGDMSNDDVLLNNIADAIAEFERSPEVNPFTSKFDYVMDGKATFTTLEQQGMEVFMDTLKGKCALCHIIDPDPNSGKILFTDFTYDNIGIPKNLFNPFYAIPSEHNPDGADFIDLGLAETTKSPENNGQFKVPSLRNVAITAPYFHNGAITSLEEAVHFYNVRDVETFDPAEVEETVNKDELGNLGLTLQEEMALVAFLKTLTDGYKL